MPAQFPNQIWDGKSVSRTDIERYALCSPEDFDQIVEEIQATQRHLLVLEQVSGFAPLILETGITNGTDTFVSIPIFDVDLIANEKRVIQSELTCQGPVNGIKFRILGPSGGVVKINVFGDEQETAGYFGSIGNVFKTERLNDFNLATNAFLINLIGVVHISVSFINGINPGTIQFQFASMVNGQNSTVFANSFIK
jgi:hypothetical protein